MKGAKINKSYTHWVTLLIGLVMMILLGLIYAWSVFVAPLENEFGWDRAQTSVTFTVSMSFFVIGLISAGLLSSKISKRYITILAVFCLLLGLLLSSRINSLLELCITYGVLVGLGVGLANNALVSTIVEWFPNRRGFAAGVLLMGYGMGGFVLSPIAVTLMNVIGWRSTFIGFGIVFSLVIGFGSIIVKPPKQSAGQAKTGVSSDLNAAQAIRQQSFWLYLLWFTMIMAGGLMVIGHASPYAQSIGATPAFAAVATGILSIFNGSGRAITGAIYDRFGLKISMIITTSNLLGAAVIFLLFILRLKRPLKI